MAYTFTTLKTAIQDYTQNTETTFVSQLTRFILNAEERILKEAQLDVFRKNASGVTTSGNKYLSKPSDFLAQNSLSVISSSENKFLLYKQVTFLQDYNPNPATTGLPLYYADWNDQSFLLSPTPDASYNVELHYFFRPVSITASGDGTSYLGNNAELALLYGSLVEAYTFMKGEADLLQLYNARFQESLQWIKNLGEGLQTRDQYRYDRLRRDVS
ncbi:hypothetical protein [Marinobacter sp.]|jgi:hypothetical protein|uniref:phage adaptor protein n=1 Tax=Marinobacter sp. TaxID=50741 RepID=UPI000C92103D|nr:hypothetical protein [Marinobacter sp.]MAK52320.1 hypothetical protein [Marinobacter sp.]|tara:strand:+ start:1707 stop:2351 length:645 start_codon:yes stop_codon:yes gene_type:complete